MTQDLITMTPKELARYEVIKKLLNKEINGTEAAEQLGLSVRQTKNIKARVGSLGPKGIMHQGRGKVGNRRSAVEFINRIEDIVRKRYPDFGPTFATEKLNEEYQLTVSKEKLRQLMIGWGLWYVKSRKRTKQYRHWRQRKEHYGEMVQFDGSYHHWFEDRAPDCCLLAAIDDATNVPTQLVFTNWEGVKNVFSFWQEYVSTKGKPLCLYVDRHSTYKQNQKSVFDDPNCLTQFERAMQDLSIKVIHAKSPQAKGRIERLFNTLQDRLIKELRLAGINTIPEANWFVKEVFLPKFIKQFSLVPAKRSNFHCPLTRYEKENIEQIFSAHSQRVVNNDFTVKFNGVWYQLGRTQPVLVRPKDRVQIEERLDNTLFLSLKNKYLNFTILPEKPKPIKTKVIALTGAKPHWKPPKDHPWRQPWIFAGSYRYQTSSRVNSA